MSALKTQLRIAAPRFFVVTCTLLGAAASANAQPVYKHVDKRGVVTFSDRPSDPKAKPVELPPINRGEVKLGSSGAESCKSHGGVNCNEGADSDGSVICTDGFREAAQRFVFACKEAKLEVVDVSDLAADGSVSAFVRNSKGVLAEGVRVSLALGKNPAPLELIGPDTVEGFGVGEYFYNPKQTGPLEAKPKKGELKVTCANCP